MIARYRAAGYPIVDIEVAATLPGFDFDRRYDFVTRSKETGAHIGIEVKSSRQGLFKVDRNQVQFDMTVVSVPEGAAVKGLPYRITGVRYEGIGLGGSANARWQQNSLYWMLRSVGVQPAITK